MCYILYMNKDVIYVEPEDDITDIILKIEKSKEKIVALVPPKKAGVFRSVVNIKLIAKAGATSNKTVVLVTVDPSIVKLAASTKLPVAKNLQSAPVVPTLDQDDENDTSGHEVIKESDDEDEDEDEDEEEEANNEDREESDGETSEEDEEDDAEDDDEEETPKKEKTKKEPKKKSGKKGGGLFSWLKNHKKMASFLGVCCAGFIIFLIWAFVFAPAVDVQVSIKTEQKNFSENISFTDVLTEEIAKDGKFYLEEKKTEITQEVKFDATGQKNRGEKAHGELTIVGTLYSGDTIAINAGDVFAYDGLSYSADNSVVLRYNKNDLSVCRNVTEEQKKEIQSGNSDFELRRCIIYATVKVTAAQPGTKYNISSKLSGWSTVVPVEVKLEGEMTGGTDDVATVVQQSDVEKAKSELITTKEEESKLKLFDSIDDKYYIIEPSFTQDTSSAVSTPAIDEEVKDGEKAVLKATTTASVYVIDKVKLEDYIREKTELDDDKKIYEIKDIYIENLHRIYNGAISKLKAQCYVGPKLTESEVVDKIKGRGLGDAQRELRDIYGVSEVKMNPSYPWVMAVPNDSNKVMVRFEIKDQSGNDIQPENEENNQENENKEESENKGDSEKKE